MNQNEVISITTEIINKHTLNILNKLGFREKPGNLSLRIGDSYGHSLGLCLAFFEDQQRSQLLEAVIVLYPLSMVWINIFDWLRLPRLCMFSRRALERKVLHVLAHELRHFWQYYTGEHIDYVRLSKFLPPKMRLVELDAERWAEDFLLGYGLYPRIAGLSAEM